MAITLRNKKVENDIREIARRTGEGPSAVIARIAAAERARLAPEHEEDGATRLACMRAFVASLPKPSKGEREAVRRAMDEMYDEHGLPR